MLVFAKVRLLDLIAKRRGQDNYKGLLSKIQLKHVDFIICDHDTSAKCIIEISYNSHNQTDREKRDEFVTEVLQASGYKILNIYNINKSKLDEICNTNINYFTPIGEGSK